MKNSEQKSKYLERITRKIDSIQRMKECLMIDKNEQYEKFSEARFELFDQYKLETGIRGIIPSFSSKESTSLEKWVEEKKKSLDSACNRFGETHTKLKKAKKLLESYNILMVFDNTTFRQHHNVAVRDSNSCYVPDDEKQAVINKLDSPENYSLKEVFHTPSVMDSRLLFDEDVLRGREISNLRDTLEEKLKQKNIDIETIQKISQIIICSKTTGDIEERVRRWASSAFNELLQIAPQNSVNKIVNDYVEGLVILGTYEQSELFGVQADRFKLKEITDYAHTTYYTENNYAEKRFLSIPQNILIAAGVLIELENRQSISQRTADNTSIKDMYRIREIFGVDDSYLKDEYIEIKLNYMRTQLAKKYEE